jgi:hypothetical protein
VARVDRLVKRKFRVFEKKSRQSLNSEKVNDENKQLHSTPKYRFDEIKYQK